MKSRIAILLAAITVLGMTLSVSAAATVPQSVSYESFFNDDLWMNPGKGANW